MQDEAQSTVPFIGTIHRLPSCTRLSATEDADSSVSNISYIVISDCNIQDTVAVHLLQKHLINFLTAEFTELCEPTHLLLGWLYGAVYKITLAQHLLP